MTDGPSMLLVEICDRRMQFFYVFAFSTFFLLLTLPYLFLVEQRSAIFAVSMLNAIGLGAISLFSGGMIWYCKRNF